MKKKQIKQAEKEKTLSRIASVAVAVFCLTSLTGEVIWFRQSHWVYSIETINRADNVMVKGFDTVISDGPLRGIRTTAEVAGVYDALDKDFAAISRAVSEGQNVYIQGRAPLGYLAIDRGYGVFSTWFRSEEFDRNIKYWAEHPEKLPEYIYVPYYDMYTYDRVEEELMAELMDDLTEIFRFDRTEGEAGAILRVTGVSLPPEDSAV